MTTTVFSPSVARRWLAAVAYVTFIYVTLEWAPRPLAFLRSHNLLRLSLRFLFVAFVATLFVSLIATKTRQAWRYVAVVLVALAYEGVARRVPLPEERLHFLEYGLVGILFLRALRPHLTERWKALAGALALGALAGAIDEWMQGRLPNRHYDVHDIWLNVLSVSLGLVVYSIFPKRRADLEAATPPSSPKNS